MRVLKGLPTGLDLPAGNRTLDPISILRVETRDGEILYPEVEALAGNRAGIRPAPVPETGGFRFGEPQINWSG